MAEGREPFHRFSEKAKGIDLQAVDDTTVLGESDLQDVMQEVTSLAERWQELGTSLGINKSDLETIHFDSPIDCLTKTLTLWLRQRYEINKFGRPTWRRLVEAVEDHEGGNNHVLAETIAQNHPGLSKRLRVQGKLEPSPRESDIHPVRPRVASHTHEQTSTAKISDSIRGVEVIGETDLVISTKEFSFEWVGFGLRLGVSKDSLPTGMEECRINIKASLSGLFELPEDSELLSPVFWISALCKFKKPVTLEIQHCASRDEASFADLNFISAKCSQKTLLYTFKQLDGGRFPTDISYGSIQLSHFSGFGIAGRKRTPRSYCAQIYYAIKEDPSDWRVYFIITKDLDAPKKCVKQEYSHFAKWESDFLIGFKKESSGISLDIPEDGQVTENGWRILPHTIPTILKKDVDNFKPGKCISKCELIVVWDPEQKNRKPERLLCKVNIKGASESKNFFHLHFNPAGNENMERHHQSTSSGGSVEYSQGSLDAVPEKKLETENVGDITIYLNELNKTAVCNLGLVLGLGYTRLQGMMDSPTFLQDMLAAWLQRVDKVQQVGVPTWKKLVEALRDPRVGQNGISTNIEQDKLKPQ